MIGIDTNILVHAFVLQDTRKHEIAKRIVQRILDGSTPALLSTQVLAEFAQVMTAKLPKPMPRDKAQSIIAVLSSCPSCTIVSYGAEEINAALVEKRPFWDALIAATMRKHGARELYTENVADFPGGTDPFATKRK